MTMVVVVVVVTAQSRCQGRPSGYAAVIGGGG